MDNTKPRADEHPVKLDASYVFHCPDLEEITGPEKIIHPDGTCKCSWSRKPYLELNFDDASFWPIRCFQKFRMKKWDMYHIYTPRHMIHFLPAWVGYGAFWGGYVYDRQTKTGVEDMHIRTAHPEVEMMPDSTRGRTLYKSKKVNAVFEVDGEYHRLKVDFPKFGGGVGMSAEIDLFHPESHDSICGVHLTNERRCHYGHKINCMPAKGWFKYGDEEYKLDPAECIGALDFGRGYYPGKLFWYWATASGWHTDGKLLGINLGFGNCPENKTENAVFYDGVLTKIGKTHCHTPGDDLMKPWRVWDDDGRVDLVFTPEMVRHVKFNLGFLYTNGRPTTGAYSGSLVTDSGKTLEVENLFGTFEWVNSQW